MRDQVPALRLDGSNKDYELPEIDDSGIDLGEYDLCHSEKNVGKNEKL